MSAKISPGISKRIHPFAGVLKTFPFLQKTTGKIKIRVSGGGQ